MFRKIVVSVALLSLALIAMPTRPAAAVNPSHRVVVSADPVDTTPHVLDGRVYAIARVGSKVVIGGTFSTARDSNDQTVLNRSRILSYDYATGRIDRTFVPQLDGVVNALVADPSGTSVFVGGSFLNVNGVANRGLVKLDLASGQMDPTFRAPTTAVVNDLAVRGSTLYVAGAFGRIRNVDRLSLAAVSTSTGAVDPNLNVPVTTPMFKGTTNIKKLDVTPDNSKMIIIGNFSSVGGQPRTQMAIINLGAPATVSSWQTNLYGNTCADVFDTYMRDVDISPNGSYAVVVTTGAAGNGTDGLCDTAARWDLDRTGSGQRPYWTDWTGGDTLLSVAVTDAAVYVGGHQRWHNNAGGRDSLQPSGVDRPGIAALDPLNGRALTWNPTRARGYGATALVATPEGLLVGSDTEQIGREFHGRIAMFPVAGGRATRVANPPTSPTGVYVAETDGDLMRTEFNNGPTGTATRVAGPEVEDWASIKGAFMVNGVLYTVSSSGAISSRTYNGTTFGPRTAVPSWLSLSDVSAVTYHGGWLLYTKPGDPRLYRRGITLDGMLIDPVPTVVSGSGDGLDWRNIIGLTVVDGKILGASTDGNLTSTVITRGVPVAATRTTISGPATGDGRNWNGRELFAFSRAPK